MAGGTGGGGLEDQDPLSVGSYSQLLLSDDVDDLIAQNCFNFTPSFSSSEQSASKVLCFGDDDHFNRECDLFFDEITANIAQKTARITCSDFSSASSTTTINTTSTMSTTTNVSSLTKSNKKKYALGAGAVNNSDPVSNSGMTNGAPVGKQRNCKRTKSADHSTETTTGRHAKVKKEKLGERVIALQQLVSPFGKTDTASVLHEALGYIRFLQEQVEILCSPYLQRLPSSAHLLEKGREERKQSESRKDLRSKGLCLVPIELTVHMAETNGADFWSPAMVNKLSSNQ